VHIYYFKKDSEDFKFEEKGMRNETKYNKIGV